MDNEKKEKEEPRYSRQGSESVGTLFPIVRRQRKPVRDANYKSEEFRRPQPEQSDEQSDKESSREDTNSDSPGIVESPESHLEPDSLPALDSTSQGGGHKKANRRGKPTPIPA